MMRSMLAIAALICGCQPSRMSTPNMYPVKSPDPTVMALDTLLRGARVYRDTEVDSPARAIFAPPHPAYPVALKSAGTTGRVEIAFVVDSMGRIELPTFHLISSTHPDFTTAVRAVLAETRFTPAVRAGQKVRMWAFQAFEFRLGG